VALVTLACPVLQVRVSPQGKTLFPDHVTRALFETLGLAPAETRLVHDMPLGGGAGASTAGLIALARTAGFTGEPTDLAQACIRAEGASDPLMFAAPDQMIWASRQGNVLATTRPLPRCDIVGGFWGAPVKTDPRQSTFPDVSDLLHNWEDAVAHQDLPAMAALASQSVQRCDKTLGQVSPLSDLIPLFGALGEVRAHTGSARGLVFPPKGVPDRVRDRLNALGFKGVVEFSTGGTT
jgi:uncharacterized protein involved in propanediol utilization